MHTYIQWTTTQPFSHWKEWNHAICSNTDATRDYHTKWCKPERKRQIPYDITYVWNLNHDTNELTYETETDSQTQRSELWLPRRKSGGMNWEFGISRRKLLNIGWINNKVLLYSTGNYVQYPAINHNEKEYEKEGVCLCVCVCVCVYNCITLLCSSNYRIL